MSFEHCAGGGQGSRAELGGNIIKLNLFSTVLCMVASLHVVGCTMLLDALMFGPSVKGLSAKRCTRICLRLNSWPSQTYVLRHALLLALLTILEVMSLVRYLYLSAAL